MDKNKLNKSKINQSIINHHAGDKNMFIFLCDLHRQMTKMDLISL